MALALAGGCTYTFSCKLGLKKIFLRPGGAGAPTAPPGYAYAAEYKRPLSLPGGVALTTYPCKLGPVIFRFRSGGSRAPSPVHPLATPMDDDDDPVAAAADDDDDDDDDDDVSKRRTTMTERSAVWRRLPDIEPDYAALYRRRARSNCSVLHSRLGSVILRDNHNHQRRLNDRLSTLAAQQTRQVCVAD